MRLYRYLVPGTALLIIGATAGPAAAAVTVSGNSVNGDSADDTIVVSCQAGDLAVAGVAGTGDPCELLNYLNVNPVGGADSVDVTAVTEATFPDLLAVSTDLYDDAADSYAGSPLVDEIYADSEDIVSTGDGNDLVEGGGTINAGAGDDFISSFEAGGAAYGGSGDDRFMLMLPSVERPTLLDGGSGFDTWEFDLTADGGFGHSFFPEGMNVTITDTAVRFAISEPAPAEVAGGLAGIESAVFTLGEGTQTWNGAGFSGEQRIRGEGDADSLTGGAGEDQLLGGSGDDTLTGNGGADRLSGAAGNDTINARDGVADVVDCGDGADKVVADAADRVVDCESVDLPVVSQPAAAPDTSAIAGPKKLSASAKGKQAKKQVFTFSSPTAGATFECAVDDGAFAACVSPFKLKGKALKKLKRGKHTLQVRAVSGGRSDASPSVAVFKVKR